MWAVVLVARLADFTFHTGPYLSANTDTVSFFDLRDLVANFDGLSYDFVAHTDWQRTVTPPASDCVDIAPTHTASVDLDINILLAKGLCFELVPGQRCWKETSRLATYLLLFEVTPFLLRIHHEPLESVWIAHCYWINIEQAMRFR